MVRKKGVYGIAIVALICFLLIVFCTKEPDTVRISHNFQAIEFEDVDVIGEDISIDKIIDTQRLRLERKFDVFKFVTNKTFNKLSMLSGGQPLRTIIVTTWRSGSTFLGDVLNSLPGNYYHYEPLLHYGIMQIRGPPHADTAIKTLKNLLNCDYTDLENYLTFGMSHIYLFTHNKRLWTQCEAYPQYCWNATFLNEFCRLFPFQSMKVVRVRLRLIEELLSDKRLNTKVILLVRDPRGTLQSRRHRDWCPGEPDCDRPDLLCADMVSDYSAAIKFNKMYSRRFRTLRYEDLSLSPYKVVQDLFDWIGINVHPEIKEFLDTHTTVNVGGVSSTYRDSKNVPFHWKNDLNYTEIQSIEATCEEAMKLWGYVKTKGPKLRDFNPLTSYTIK
ncbi:carbohydrate sulfotransferase 5-like [Cylas formicarius]|uniref:carbohydrate sulfotransferase 5-like n=1 Tax=Cylas formicarius TaxID=197179 RepID=UPI002958412E|nr:carbohydrate sulfotransferase 5-like [Cylas formicarius]